MSIMRTLMKMMEMKSPYIIIIQHDIKIKYEHFADKETRNEGL